MKSILENIINDIRYDDLGLWKSPGNISYFSEDITLFEYQKKAIENITKVLYLYYKNNEGTPKSSLFKKYKEYRLDARSLSGDDFVTKHKKRNGLINKRFSFFANHFQVIKDLNEEYISDENFINRAAFWMATGSGKSIVLIKVIELLDYLQRSSLIPKKEIMLLLPRADLITQFQGEITKFNRGREKKIDLVNLKDYENDKYQLPLSNNIKVYYYRSDLLRDETTKEYIDYRNYENNGNWYIFLDEAHRGEKGDSLVQDYITVLCKNGFLFNFSATFTEDIDYKTSCCNFNLEKFILAGYGKNLYLSKSYFQFTRDKDDFSQEQKQLQVLKSLIIFSLVKKSKTEDTYHNPMLMTLVNSVNIEDSDLLMFFLQLGKIAGGGISKRLFSKAKKELLDEFNENPSYVFGDEILKINCELIKKINERDILKQVFNTNNPGKITLLEGEAGKEIVLLIETSERPFALIKVGDAKKFQREKLSADYEYTPSFDKKNIFDGINKNPNINLLLGSRSFYEGWDSNRPNVINMINIGKKDAKKFVLQGIGRGIRIEPYTGKRQRLDLDDDDKNILLETLFVFATDKSAVKAIIDTVEEQEDKNVNIIDMFEDVEKPFDILIPQFEDIDNRKEIAKFNIAREDLNRFKNYLAPFSYNTLLIKTHAPQEYLDFVLSEINNNTFFQKNEETIYYDMDLLLQKVIWHSKLYNKKVSEIKYIDDEIIHFKHIKAINFSNEELESLKIKITRVKEYQVMDKQEIERQFRSKEITLDQATSLNNARAQESFNDSDTDLELKIRKIAEHYYMPLIYSEKQKDKYIQHIINVPGETKFIKNLEDYTSGKSFNCEWMFSKIDDSLDKIFIPYFYKKDNTYRNFYPDFIFWIKKNNEYKIIFVDPKGTEHTDYQYKVDGFEELFLSNTKPKVFKHNDFDFNITFDLKLIAKDINNVSGKYKDYWLHEDDFSFLDL